MLEKGDWWVVCGGCQAVCNSLCVAHWLDVGDGARGAPWRMEGWARSWRSSRRFLNGGVWVVVGRLAEDGVEATRVAEETHFMACMTACILLQQQAPVRLVCCALGVGVHAWQQHRWPLTAAPRRVLCLGRQRAELQCAV